MFSVRDHGVSLGLHYSGQRRRFFGKRPRQLGHGAIEQRIAIFIVWFFHHGRVVQHHGGVSHAHDERGVARGAGLFSPRQCLGHRFADLLRHQQRYVWRTLDELVVFGSRRHVGLVLWDGRVQWQCRSVVLPAGGGGRRRRRRVEPVQRRRPRRPDDPVVFRQR